MDHIPATYYEYVAQRDAAVSSNRLVTRARIPEWPRATDKSLQHPDRLPSLRAVLMHEHCIRAFITYFLSVYKQSYVQNPSLENRWVPPQDPETAPEDMEKEVLEQLLHHWDTPGAPITLPTTLGIWGTRVDGWDEEFWFDLWLAGALVGFWMEQFEEYDLDAEDYWPTLDTVERNAEFSGDRFIGRMPEWQDIHVWFSRSDLIQVMLEVVDQFKQELSPEKFKDSFVVAWLDLGSEVSQEEAESDEWTGTLREVHDMFWNSDVGSLDDDD